MKEESKDNAVSISEVFLELEFVKRELYSSINYSKTLEQDKQKLQKNLIKMEDEMQVTIETYRNVIETYEKEGETDVRQLKREIEAMQKQHQELERAR
jgi:hypothetical protein